MILSSLERRIIDISFRKKLSHLGSCLTAVDLIDHIYRIKKPGDIFVLSNGHAGLALYTVLEKHGLGNAEELFDKHGVHPNTDPEHGIVCSTGSLGHGIGIAVGMAIANPDKAVFVLMSDGECAEGSVWEALRIASELRLCNLFVTVNANGYSATRTVDVNLLEHRLNVFFPCVVKRTSMNKYPEFLRGLQAHYHPLSKEEYEEIIREDPVREST